MPKKSLAIAAMVLFLSACDSGGTQSSAPDAAPAPTAASAPAAVPVGNTTLVPGTAESNGAAPGTGDLALPQGGVPIVAKLAVVEKWVQLTKGKAGGLDPIVVNGAGLTLYRFDKDSADPAKATCDDDCAQTWPPVTIQTGGKIFISGLRQADVGTVTRDDGRLQVTIHGWPVYRFAKDTKAGDTKGQGVGGTWFGVRPDGGKAGNPDAAKPTTSAVLPAGVAVFFDEPGFSDKGASQGVSGKGCKNLRRRHVASSIAAPGHLKIWTHRDCKGAAKVINGDVANLGSIGFDNKISSVFLG